MRIGWNGYVITFNGRSDNAQIPGDLKDILNRIFVNEETAQIFEQKFGEKEVMLVGEGYGKGIQSGGCYRDHKGFILFDIKVGDTWLGYEDMCELAKAFNVDVVPVVFKGTIREVVEFVKSKPLSQVAQEDVEMEGVVGTPLVGLRDTRGNRIIVKIKGKDFVR